MTEKDETGELGQVPTVKGFWFARLAAGLAALRGAGEGLPHEVEPRLNLSLVDGMSLEVIDGDGRHLVAASL